MISPKHGTLVVVMALASLFMAGGCMWAPELTDVKQDIARQMPGVGFRKSVTLSFGPLTMAFARGATGLIPDAHEARGFLRDVSGVQVAVYEIEGTPKRVITTPSRLTELLKDGWEMAVRVREESEVVWLLYLVDGDSVREMLVVVMDDEELVLVKLKGRLERLIAHALRHARDEGGFVRPADAFNL